MVHLAMAFHLWWAMASVATICSVSLLILPCVIPGREPQKGDKGVTSMKVKWVLLRSPQAAVGRICVVFCLAERKMQQDAKNRARSFPDWASIQDKYYVVWQNIVKIKFGISITLREYLFGGASWLKIALQLLFKNLFFIKPSKQEYVKVLATKSTFQWENNGIH